LVGKRITIGLIKDNYRLSNTSLSDFNFISIDQQGSYIKPAICIRKSITIIRVKDLTRLWRLGQENPEPLKTLRFDLDKLTQADTIAREMAGSSGKANDHMYGGKEQKLTRDKAILCSIIWLRN
jgi:hypothetical protein